MRIQTIQLQPQTVPELYEAVGTVRPKLSAQVSPKVMSAILEIPVKTGDAVKSGDVLVKLDDRELQARFRQADADYQRFTALLAKQAATRAEYETVEARYRVAKAALSDTIIAAPFDGVITEKLCDVGDMASPGKPLFDIEQIGNFRLEAIVPDRLADAVGVGKPVRVILGATGEDCAGVIGEIISASDPSSRSFLIKVDLSCQQPLKSGMFGRAILPVGERTGLFVPKTIVHERGQLTFLFVASDGRAQMRLVKTGKAVGEQIELLAGVDKGEHVIVGAAGGLTDGGRVQE